MALDLVSVVFVAVFIHSSFPASPFADSSLRAQLLAALPFAYFVVLSSHLCTLYRMDPRPTGHTLIVRTVQGVLLGSLGLFGLQSLWATTQLSAEQIGLSAVLSACAMIFTRALWRRRRSLLYQRDIALRNYLIVGADPVGRDVLTYLSTIQKKSYRFKGFVSFGEPGDDPPAENSGEILGEIQDVIAIARSEFIDEIIFSRRPSTPGVLSQVLHQAQAMGITIRLIPSLTETLIDRTDVQYIGDLPTILVYQARERAYSMLMKRTFDLVCATSAFIVLLPVMLIVAIAVKLSSPGPVMYPSQRIGHKGRTFTCFKFRTMVNGADAMQAQLAHLNERKNVLFKISNDPRVTPLGAFLRKYSLDELPQLWNVIRGDMSLVGPRPPIGSEVAQYGAAQLRRLDAVPGITGLWQVEARQDPSFESYITLDSAYVNQWSFGLDLRILMRTVSAVFRGTGS